MYIAGTARRPLIKGEYGDGKSQETLRASFNSDKDKILMYLRLDSSKTIQQLSDWEDQWREAAAAHLAATTAKKRGAKLVYHHLLRVDEDSAMIKINVPYYVLDDCAKKAGIDDVFELGHAHYKIVFRVTGMWQNSANYGLSLSAMRVLRVKDVEYGTKRKCPSEFEFPEDDDDSSDE